MKIESEIFHEGIWIQIEESDSVTIPWKCWTGGKFLAGGKTRDKAIEAAKVTIDNRLHPGISQIRNRIMGMKNTKTAVIARIEQDDDRTLLYPVQKPSRLGEWFIITSPEKALHIHPGDKVIYEPKGVNFGWFVEVTQ